LCSRLKDPFYVEKLTFKRALQLLISHGNVNEHECAVSWFESEKSRIKSSLESDTMKATNLNDVLDMHFSDGEDEEDPELKLFRIRQEKLGL
jgi:hypothetical protein